MILVPLCGMAAKKSAKKKSAKAKKSSASKSAKKSFTATAKQATPAASPAVQPAKPMSMLTFAFIILAGALFIIGYFMGLVQGGSVVGMDDTMHHASNDAGHAHELVDVGNQDLIPQVTVDAYKDLDSGYNIRIITTNFEIVPEHVGTVFVPNEGHGHLYVNGEKVARVYGEWYHLDSLPPGKHEIKVTLNSHDHKELALGTNTIAASTTIVVE